MLLKIIWQHLKRPGIFFFGCFKRRDAHLCPGDIRSRYSSGTAGERDGRSFDCAEYLRAMLNGGNHCKNDSKRRYGRISSSGIYRIYSMHFVLCVESVPGCLHISATTFPVCLTSIWKEAVHALLSTDVPILLLCFFPLSLSFFATLSLQGLCRRDHHSEACNIFWKHDLAKQLHHVECTQYKTQHGGVLAAQFAVSVKTVSHDLLQDQYK